jgi:hypothetical protein
VQTKTLFILQKERKRIADAIRERGTTWWHRGFHRTLSPVVLVCTKWNGKTKPVGPHMHGGTEMNGHTFLTTKQMATGTTVTKTLNKQERGVVLRRNKHDHILLYSLQAPSLDNLS